MLGFFSKNKEIKKDLDEKLELLEIYIKQKIASLKQDIKDQIESLDIKNEQEKIV